MSDKPVHERLQVKRDRRLAVVGAPPAADAACGPAELRAGVAEAEVVVLFVLDRAGFDTLLPPLAAQIRDDAILWVAYPKLTSTLAGDLSRDVIHRAAPPMGLGTVSQVAIDADWSALRLKRLG